MAAFVKGDVVVVPFPFSDLTKYYKRSYVKAIAIQTQSLLIWKQTRDSYDLGNDSNTQKGRTPPV
jgi:hypothetical protein